MPPRYAYWTIIIDNAPTAFRAREREELLPTFRQLVGRNPTATIKWFARGRLWESPEQARAAAAPPPRERRDKDWRPGGRHEDPRARFKKKSAGPATRAGGDERTRERRPEQRRPTNTRAERGPRQESGKAPHGPKWAPRGSHAPKKWDSRAPEGPRDQKPDRRPADRRAEKNRQSAKPWGKTPHGHATRRDNRKPERGAGPGTGAPTEPEPPVPQPPEPPGPDRPPRPGQEPRPETPGGETIRILPDPPERAGQK